MTVEETFEYQTRPETRQVICIDCNINDRWGCAECAEHYADWHRAEFGHDVAVVPHYHSINRKPARRTRNWWER